MLMNTTASAVLGLMMTMTATATAQGTAPGGSQDGERLLVVRTVEDPTVSALPAGCPFTAPNVLLGATT